MKQYKEKYDFINKALLESVAQVTEMTKSDHPMVADRVKSADKMVMLPPLFNGSKPEVAKQHYKRFNQYIKFQTKSGNIRDTIAEAIELFEHTLDKKALACFSKGITHGEKQKGINCNYGTFLFLTLKRLMLMNTLICSIH